MSIRLMSQVWSDAPFEGGALLVLLALADYANDDGESFPSVESLALKARLSERQTQRTLITLVSERWLSIYGGEGRGKAGRRTSLYRLTPQPRGDMVTPVPAQGVTSETERGDAGDTRGVTSETKRGDVGVTQIRQLEPPEEPSDEPSAKEPPLLLPTDLGKVMDAWTNATGTTVTALVGDAMAVALEDLPLDWVLDAIRETGMNGVKRWGYTQTILNRWQVDGRDVPYENLIAPAPSGYKALTLDELLASGLKRRYKTHTFAEPRDAS